MKKLFIISALIFTLALPTPAHAAGSLTATLTGDSTFKGDSITLSLTTSGASGATGVSSITASITASPAGKVTISAPSNINGNFSTLSTSPLALLSMDYVSNGTVLAKYTITKTANLAKGDKITITATCSAATDQNGDDVACTSGSKTIEYTPDDPAPIKTTPSNPTPQTTTPTNPTTPDTPTTPDNNDNDTPTSNNDTQEEETPTPPATDDTVNNTESTTEKSTPFYKKSTFLPWALFALSAVLNVILALLLVRKNGKISKWNNNSSPHSPQWKASPTKPSAPSSPTPADPISTSPNSPTSNPSPAQKADITP